MTDELNLLPCPFCGIPNTYRSNRYVDHYQVHCHACGAAGPSGATYENAITAWNERPAMTDPTFDTLEALEVWESYSNVRLAHVVERAVLRHNKYEARVRAAHSHLLKGHDDA